MVRFGMFKLGYMEAVAYSIVSMSYIILFWSGHNSNIYMLVGFFVFQFFIIGSIFGNLRTLTMQPLGHLASMRSTLNEFISTARVVPIAHYVSGFVKTSVRPLFIGFLIFV